MLATLQVLATVTLRGRAVPGAWVTFVPEPAARRIVALGDALPLPQTLRLVIARAALTAGDAARARYELRFLAPSPDRAALVATLARAEADLDGAVRGDLAAGDYAALAGDLDLLAARGALARALAIQRVAAARLAVDRTAPAASAQAQYRLGVFEEATAERLAPGSPQRRSHEAAAADAYARALALGPLDERYLLAAANQALNMNDWPLAARTFARARALDPAGADPVAGLGDLALRQGDRAAARTYLVQARALDPTSAAVVRLARKLGGP